MGKRLSFGPIPGELHELPPDRDEPGWEVHFDLAALSVISAQIQGVPDSLGATPSDKTWTGGTVRVFWNDGPLARRSGKLMREREGSHVRMRFQVGAPLDEKVRASAGASVRGTFVFVGPELREIRIAG